MPARQMTVCFSGYRPEKLPWGYDECDPRCAQLKQRLRRAICAACDDGFRHFICGMARGVDTYCAEIVLALRPQYPDLTLEAAIPCPSQCGGWTPDQQARWHAIVDRCDFERWSRTATVPAVCSAATATWWTTPPASSPCSTVRTAAPAARWNTPSVPASRSSTWTRSSPQTFPLEVRGVE